LADRDGLCFSSEGNGRHLRIMRNYAKRFDGEVRQIWVSPGAFECCIGQAPAT
jgi:hypothetical protein